jgi:hypothetical protein
MVSLLGLSPFRLKQKTKVYISTINILKTSSAVHRANLMSAVNINCLSTDHVFSELTCVSDRNIPENFKKSYTASSDSLIELNGIGDD